MISTAVAFPTRGNNNREYQAMNGTRLMPSEKYISSYLDDKNEDVVLVLHSYDGWPGSRAVEGLDKETGQENGKAAGIVEVVFSRRFSAAR